MNELINLALTNPNFNALTKQIKDKISPITLLGLTDVAKMYLVAAIEKIQKKPICIITYNEIQAKKLMSDLEKFIQGVYFFPKKEIVTYDYLAESKETPYARMKVLNALKGNKVKVCITTIEAVMQPMITKNDLYKNMLQIKLGDSYSVEYLKRTLARLGYERCDLIEGKGQFSIRGDIVDIGIEEDRGIRIELWGEEVDSIRYFSFSSQRSTEEIK